MDYQTWIEAVIQINFLFLTVNCIENSTFVFAPNTVDISNPAKNCCLTQSTVQFRELLMNNLQTKSAHYVHTMYSHNVHTMYTQCNVHTMYTQCTHDRDVSTQYNTHNVHTMYSHNRYTHRPQLHHVWINVWWWAKMSNLLHVFQNCQ